MSEKGERREEKERERGGGEGRDGVEGRVRGWDGGRLCCGHIII